MPGKHAPDSPASWYLSLARAGTGALAAVGIVVVIVLVAVGSGGGQASPNAAPGATTSSTPSNVSTTPAASSSPTPSEEPTPTIRARRAVPIEVLNGTSRAGLAASVQSRLEAKNYRKVSIGNAPSAGKTTIFVADGWDEEAARLLREFPELSRIKPRRGSTPGSAPVTVVLGSDYAG